MANIMESRFAQVAGPTSKKTGEYFFEGESVVLVQLSEDEQRRKEEISVITELNLGFVVFYAFVEQAKRPYWLVCQGNEGAMKPFNNRRQAGKAVKKLNREG